MQPKQPSSSGDDNNNKPSSSWYPQSQDDQAFLDLAIDEACKGLKSGDGGPFGAVIVLRGKVIVQEHNRVLSTLDPTAHAEVVAIRKACEILQTHQLQDCFLYASCQPCPMCFGAIHWSRIASCRYAATSRDAALAGFDDQLLYENIRNMASHLSLSNVSLLIRISTRNISLVRVIHANLPLHGNTLPILELPKLFNCLHSCLAKGKPNYIDNNNPTCGNRNYGVSKKYRLGKEEYFP
jgi:guanine deaminase